MRVQEVLLLCCTLCQRPGMVPVGVMLVCGGMRADVLACAVAPCAGVQIKSAYLHAVRNAVPAHLQIGDFWDAPEVKASLALLRAVVHPVAASEGIKRRIVKSSSEVKVPITSGFGESLVPERSADKRAKPSGSTSCCSGWMRSCLCRPSMGPTWPH